MSAERYIVIPSWGEFQHYKGKDRPAWIKLYPRLLRHDDFLELTPSQRMVLVGLWMLYAESGQRIAVDTAKLTRSLNQRVTKQTLDRLSQAGFIEFRSREALDELYAREEVLRTSSKRARASEPKKNGSRSRSREEKPAAPAVCPECGIGGGRHLIECSLARNPLLA